MVIDFKFIEVIKIKALVEREIERDKELITICRNNLHRDIDEDLQNENKKVIELCETQIAALEEILQKLNIDY